MNTEKENEIYPVQPAPFAPPPYAPPTVAYNVLQPMPAVIVGPQRLSSSPQHMSMILIELLALLFLRLALTRLFLSEDSNRSFKQPILYFHFWL